MHRRLSLLGLLLLAMVAAACSSGTSGPQIEDPKEIVTKAVTALSTTKTVHFRVDVNGSIKADLTNSGTKSDISLAGTTIEGDIDITDQSNAKLKATFAVPALLGLNGDVVVVDKSTYVKTSLTGPLYTKQDNASSPVGQAGDPQKALDELKKALEQPGVTTTKLADEKCGDKDCYHVSITIAPSVLQGAMPSAAPTGLGDIVLELWVQKSDLRPVKLATKIVIPDAGNVEVVLSLTNYDVPVTIAAPPPDQVKQ